MLWLRAATENSYYYCELLQSTRWALGGPGFDLAATGVGEI